MRSAGLFARNTSVCFPLWVILRRCPVSTRFPWYSSQASYKFEEASSQVLQRGFKTGELTKPVTADYMFDAQNTNNYLCTRKHGWTKYSCPVPSAKRTSCTLQVSANQLHHKNLSHNLNHQLVLGYLQPETAPCVCSAWESPEIPVLSSVGSMCRSWMNDPCFWNCHLPTVVGIMGNVP